MIQLGRVCKVTSRRSFRPSEQSCPSQSLGVLDNRIVRSWNYSFPELASVPDGVSMIVDDCQAGPTSMKQCCLSSDVRDVRDKIGALHGKIMDVLQFKTSRLKREFQ